MTAKKLYILLICFSLTSISIAQQKVGLVLSGGGASGFAHIGVLEALEEHGIPVDYITGTSAGALIGSLYASGYSPKEIKAYVLSENFQVMTGGKLKPDQHFLLRDEELHSGMFSFSFSKDSISRSFLPTNVVSSNLLDFEMMQLLGPVSASRGNDFNELFVPFRCVASDVFNKKSVVFDKGDLNAAVRASMTFPFYLKPTSINGSLLFDGGLYNNFPADIMYHDFNPDYIIGSNVSYNASPPDDDDLIGQLTNMLVSHSTFELPCEEGLIIEPPANLATFEFDQIAQAIDAGYRQTIASIDTIRKYVTERISPSELDSLRALFRNGIHPIQITGVTTSSIDTESELNYARNALYRRKKREILGAEEIEKRYFRLYAASQVDFLFPTLKLKADSTYQMHVAVKKAKEFRVELGGHLSSRPVNTGYVGLSYQSLGKILTKTKLESYFGKFYGSARASFTLDIPAVYPISTTVYFILNRWDYFKSFATFFEDVQPSFLVQNEVYAGLKIDLPLGNTITSSLDGRVFKLDDRYYQNEVFTNKDTADLTNFNGSAFSWSVVQNSLNRKQFANSGHFFRFQARYVFGREHSTSGSTSINEYDIIQNHNWINLGLDYQSFIVDQPAYHLGLHGQMVFNSQTQFANYTSTLLSMTEFSLLPDVKTYFLPEYRSPQFIALGMNHIFTIREKIDVRIDGYLYQPFIQIIENTDGTLSLSKPFKGDTYLASASVIYHSFIGPIRITANYFPKQLNPFAVQFSIGYILFNDRAIR